VSTAVNPGVSFVNCAFTLQNGQPKLPNLVVSTRSPSASVVDRVLVLRRAQRPSDRLNLATLDRDGLRVFEVYGRYTRLLRGPRGEDIELVPAWICPRANHPVLALLAVTMDRPRRTLLWATAAALSSGAQTIQLRSGFEQLSATILADGRTRILVGHSASSALSSISDRQV
jgi:hypothetical protein